MNQFGSGAMFPSGLNQFLSNNFGHQGPGPMNLPQYPNQQSNVPHFNAHPGPMQMMPGPAQPNASSVSSAIGQKTNASDMYSRQSRIYVGSISHKMSREQLISIFSNYGKVTGLSHLKGYAFVQYDNPKSARMAATRENGKSHSGMSFECNVVSDEKKPTPQQPTGSTAANSMQVAPANRGGGAPLSRGPSGNMQSSSATNSASALTTRRPIGNNNNATNSGGFNQRASADGGGVSNLKRIAVSSSKANQPPIKRTNVPGSNQRPQLEKSQSGPVSNVNSMKRPVAVNAQKKMVAPSPVQKSNNKAQQSSSDHSLNKAVTVSTDILVCGACRHVFSDIDAFRKHKAEFGTSNCQKLPCELLCSTCNRAFTCPWALLQHSQNDHNLQLYKLGEKEALDPVGASSEIAWIKSPVDNVDTKQESLDYEEDVAHDNSAHSNNNNNNDNNGEGNKRTSDKFGRRHSSLSRDSSDSTLGRAESNSNNGVEHPGNEDSTNSVTHPMSSPQECVLDDDNLLGGRDDMSDIN